MVLPSRCSMPHFDCRISFSRRSLLAVAVAVDVGVVEEVQAEIESGFEETLGFGAGETVQAHAADRERGGCQTGFADLDGFHVFSGSFRV